ncbi:MAG TPA: tetratricopeptide repeat protein [Xanthobacteraceae bacterium]|nr:tetratricopeptide repeat protein [Xanthobacteraceae bacterium]
MADSNAALLQEGLMLHRRGAVGEAASRYSEVLRSDPVNAEALYYLAVIACQHGRFGEGVELARRALGVNAKQARTHNLLGLALARLGQDAAALRSFDDAVACQPDFAEAHGNRANALAGLGRLSEALASYDRAVGLRPDSCEDWCNRGSVLLQLDRPAEAIESYDRALLAKPDFVDAHLQRGVALALVGRHQEALASYDKALEIAPAHADALNNRGNTLRKLARHDEALESFDRAIRIAPNHVAALSSRAAALSDLGRHDAALASCDSALAVDPRSVDALNVRGSVLMNLGRHEEALTNFDTALAAKPDHVGALNNRGIALGRLDRHEQALASFERALAIKPDDVDALNNRGNALFSLMRNDEALASYDSALLAAPGHVDARCNRGHVLVELGRHAEALATYDAVLATRPDHVDAVYRRGVLLRRLQRFEEAIDCYRRALALDPGHPDAFSGLVLCLLLAGDRAEIAALSDEIAARAAAGTSPLEPFILLAIDSTPAQQLACARNYVRLKGLTRTAAPAVRRREHAGKLRLAYLSADFRRHPVAYLIAHLFRLHDRSRFEVIGISFGRDDRSEMRARIAKSFDQFHDVAARTDRQVAELVRELGIDIAVDLMGHTEDSRLGVLADRPAPVQLTYLGYPSTTGADFIDYVIADPVVLPFDQQPFYTEKIVHLPECYLVNDATKAIAPRTPSRREAGLPDAGVVFCCFNHSYKIAPPTFAVWMRLLSRVPGGVLWLSRTSEVAARNLRRSAAAHGIDPERVIFAPRVERMEDHLARFRLADLFLDTLPYNGHTTASDALWAGVPVVTCAGVAFAGRVAASLLKAIGAPELVTHDLADYEALALALATDSSARDAVRRKVADHRASHPLFDTDRTRRHLESAYTTMWDIYRRGETPRSFRVEPIERPS